MWTRLARINQNQELKECIPMSFDVKHRIFVANVLHQQGLLSAVFDRASGKIQLVWKIYDGSCTSSFDGHNKLFSFSNTGQHMGIILQEKETIITCENTNDPDNYKKYGCMPSILENSVVCVCIYIYSMKSSPERCTFNEIN